MSARGCVALGLLLAGCNRGETDCGGAQVQTHLSEAYWAPEPYGANNTSVIGEVDFSGAPFVGIDAVEIVSGLRGGPAHVELEGSTRLDDSTNAMRFSAWVDGRVGRKPCVIVSLVANTVSCKSRSEPIEIKTVM